MFFDTHAHYDDERFDGDRDAVLSGLAAAGVSYVINAGSDVGSSLESRELASRYKFIYYAAGFHPHCAADAPDDVEDALAPFFCGEKAVAVGEIGLDYHYDFSPRERQKEVFSRQLDFARRAGAPAIIHNREADGDAVDIVRPYARAGLRGVFHCFSGGRELAKQVLDMGFYIAFGGSLTFKNAHALREAAAYAPADRLLIETDCPYMAPVPFRGRRNDSSLIRYVAERVASIKNMDTDETARITGENAKTLFSITR